MSIGTNYTATINKATVLGHLPNWSPVHYCFLNYRDVPVTFLLCPD